MVEAIYTQDFIRLWDSYPRNVGKGAAFRAFNKLKCTSEDVDRIIVVVERYKQTDQWKKDEGQYIPYLATFLNQRRFDDQPQIKTGGFDGIGKFFPPRSGLANEFPMPRWRMGRIR